MKLNKKLFYEHLKSFSNNNLPISISMTTEDYKYRINLSEDRITTMKINFNPNFIMQILDTSKTGYEKYVCPDIEFNLIDKDIKTDYQLYKFVNNLIGKYIDKE